MDRLLAFVDAHPELLNVVLFLAVLTLVLHAVLVYWLKIGGLAWKALDYLWYVPAVIGVVLLYCETVENNITRQVEKHEQVLSISGQELSRNIMFLLQDARCETVRARVREDSFLINPSARPDASQELANFCSSAAALRRSVDRWMHSSKWPEASFLDLLPGVGIDLPIEYSLPAIIDMFNNLNARYHDQFATEAIDTYSKELIFSGGNSDLLREMRENLADWNQAQRDLENVRSLTWASNNGTGSSLLLLRFVSRRSGARS